MTLTYAIHTIHTKLTSIVVYSHTESHTARGKKISVCHKQFEAMIKLAMFVSVTNNACMRCLRTARKKYNNK